MPDLPESRKMPHRIHDVVRSLALRLVDDQGAVKGSGLWLTRHWLVVGKIAVADLKIGYYSGEKKADPPAAKCADEG
jgi:hypothetical protein